MKKQFEGQPTHAYVKYAKQCSFMLYHKISQWMSLMELDVQASREYLNSLSGFVELLFIWSFFIVFIVVL